jgi:hypothetical protein
MNVVDAIKLIIKDQKEYEIFNIGSEIQIPLNLFVK